MAVANNLAKNQNQTNNLTLSTLVKKMEKGGAFAKALPAVMTPERFARIALSALNNNDALQKCTGTSFLAALMNAAQLGLEPNTPLGQAYLIPYGNQCQFQIGYQGLLDLAFRTKQYKWIAAETVYENDEFHYELGMHRDLKHVPAQGDRGTAVAYYAAYQLVNGGEAFVVMTKEEVKKHRAQFSKAKNSPWNDNFDAMAKKTVLKQLMKYAPKSSNISAAISTDETVKNISADDASNNVDVTTVAPENIINAETGEIMEAEVTNEAPADEESLI